MNRVLWVGSAALLMGLSGCGGGDDMGSLDAGRDAQAVDANMMLTDQGVGDGSMEDGSTGLDGGVECPTPTPSPEARATIGSAGGTLTLGPATLTIPAGALASDMELVLTPTIIELPTARRALTAVYAVTPENVSFSVPATLTVSLGALPSTPDDIALFTGSTAAGPFTQVTTSRATAAYSASLSSTGYGFAGRVSAAPTPTTSTCTATTLNPAGGVLFSAVPVGGNYYQVHARQNAAGSVFTASYMKDALFNAFASPYSAAGVAGTSANLTGNTVAAILGGVSVESTDDSLLVAYDSNLTEGSEVWVARRSATGAAMGSAVRVSQDAGIYSQRPQLVALPGGGAFVVWRALTSASNEVYLRAAVLDSALQVQTRFNVTDPADGIPIGERGLAEFTLVSDGATVGIVWSWADNNAAAGVRYQAYFANGCPRTEVIEVAAGLISPVLVSAALRGSQVVALYSRSNATDGSSSRLRVIDLTTGHLGPSRLYGLELSHTGIAVHTNGFVLAGATALEERAFRLSPEFDRVDLPFVIGATSAQNTVAGVTTNAAGTQMGAGWVSVGGTTEGRVGLATCP